MRSGEFKKVQQRAIEHRKDHWRPLRRLSERSTKCRRGHRRSLEFNEGQQIMEEVIGGQESRMKGPQEVRK
jgi:hypothetical protein